MNDFFKQISDPTWWVSVVVVGLLINLASDYLKPLLDRLMEKSSAVRKRANEKQAIRFQSDLNQLLDDPSRVIDLKLDILYFNLRSVLQIAISLAVNAILEPIFPVNTILSITLLTYAFGNMKEDSYCRKVLRAYLKAKGLMPTPP